MKMQKKRIGATLIKLSTCAALITLVVLGALIGCNQAKAQTEKQGFEAKYVFYNAPIDIELLDHISALSDEYDIPVEIILAVIEKESNYDSQAIGDDGKSFGLMQVQEICHSERMLKLKCTDLFDPYQNITVGVDYLAECLEKNGGDMEKALVAYNMGQKGAERWYFSVGIYSTEYSRTVLEISEKITEGVQTTMFYTDDPVADYDRYSEEQDKQLQKYPQCSICDKHIQDDFYYEINGEVLCEECLNDEYRKNVEEYVE